MAEVIANISVVSAVALKQTQIYSLETLMSEKFNAPVALTLTIDPSIIGGIIIRAGGYLLDCTVKTQLRNMKTGVMNGVDADTNSDIVPDVGDDLTDSIKKDIKNDAET